MKKVAVLLLLFLFVFAVRVSAQTQMEALMERYDYDIEVAGSDFADNTRRIAAGESVGNFQSIFARLTGLVRSEGSGVLALLLKVVAVSVLFALLSNLQHSTDAKGVQDAVFFVCYIVISALVLEAFRDAVRTFESAIGSAVVFMNGSVPILIGLLVTGGKSVTAAGIQPVILSGCVLLSNAVRFFIVPILYCIAALSMVSGISRTVSVGGLAAFLKKTARWGLCLLLTAFSGLLIVQGFGTGALDALTAKTTRYVVSNGVPVVGGILSDTLDTVVSSARVIKNATGAAGIIALFGICLAPIVKIGLTSLAFHLAAAVIEPVTDRRIFTAVGAVAEVMSLMVGVICAVFVMLVICIAMVMGIG